MSEVIYPFGSLSVKIISYEGSQMIPKKFDLLDAKLSNIRSLWIEEDNVKVPNIKPGIYVARLFLTSGMEKEEVIEIEESKECNLIIDISSLSPEETQEWAYFNKTQYLKDEKINKLSSTELSKPIELNTQLWTFDNGNWNISILQGMGNFSLSRDGITFRKHLSYEMHVLQVSEFRDKKTKSFFVCLPPSQDLHCLIRPHQGSLIEGRSVDVIISTNNWRAEALLSLISNGSIREAKTLFNAKEAEDLLQHKIDDPIAAAIGGYFLLKIGELGRIHNWANNLANWFPWMPDGAVIHARQLLQDKAKVYMNVRIIRKRLVDAVQRGIPIFSEGLRLLYEGLVMLSYHFKQKDTAVEQALAIIKEYIEAADLSQQTSVLKLDGLLIHHLKSLEKYGFDGFDNIIIKGRDHGSQFAETYE